MATYPYTLDLVTSGYTGIAASLLYTVTDAGGVVRLGPVGTGIAEETDAAGLANTGAYRAAVTLDTAWAFPLRVKWTATGQTGFVALDVIHGDSYSGVSSLLATTARFAALPTAGSVDDPSPTATSFLGDFGLSVEDDTYNLRTLQFTSGDLAGAVRVIADYDGATRRLSFSLAFPAIPADGDTFEVV